MKKQVTKKNLEDIFINIPDCVIILDLWGFVINCTKTAQALFPQMKIGKKADFLFKINAESEVSLSDGRLFHQVITPVLEHGVETGQIIWLTDITELRLLIDSTEKQNKELEQINAQMIQANEKLEEIHQKKAKLARIKESVNVAHELHDSVGHTLTSLNTLYRASKIYLDKKPESVLEHMEKCEELLCNTISDISLDMDFSKKNEMALSSLLNELKLSTVSIKLHLKINGIEKREHNTLIKDAYRICQEAVTNALRHSGAANIYLQITFTDSYLELIIYDDGIVNNTQEGFGMQGMRNRVKSNRGDILFTKTAEGGLMIKCYLYI